MKKLKSASVYAALKLQLNVFIWITDRRRDNSPESELVNDGLGLRTIPQWRWCQKASSASPWRSSPTLRSIQSLSSDTASRSASSSVPWVRTPLSHPRCWCVWVEPAVFSTSMCFSRTSEWCGPRLLLSCGVCFVLQKLNQPLKQFIDIISAAWFSAACMVAWCFCDFYTFQKMFRNERFRRTFSGNVLLQFCLFNYVKYTENKPSQTNQTKVSDLLDVLML